MLEICVFALFSLVSLTRGLSFLVIFSKKQLLVSLILCAAFLQSVFWPGEFHGLCSPWGRKESTRLSDFHFHFSLSLVYLGFICFLLSIAFIRRSIQ